MANSIGGGCTGLAALIPIASGADASFGSALLFIVLIGLFAFGVLAGFKLSVPGASGLRWMRAYLLVQAPVMSSPLWGFQFVSVLGLPLSVGVVGSGMDTQFTAGWAMIFGSECWISLAQGAPLRIGVNVVAIALLTLTSRALRRAAASAPLGPAETSASSAVSGQP